MARKHPQVSRRKFLAGVAVAGAATAVTPPGCAHAATTHHGARGGRRRCRRRRMSRPPRPERRRTLPRIGGVAGSDFMVDVIKTLDIKYLPSNCGLELPRHPRVADQLRRQQDAGVPHLHARGIRGRHGARLFQDRRQAADDALPRHGRPAARRHGDLQRLVRPRAGHRRRRQRSRRRAPAAGRADLPLGAGHQRAGARLHQVGRHAGLAAALRAVVRARLQDRDDAALRARSRSRSTPACSRSRSARTARSSTSRATCRPRRRRAIPAP